MSGWNIAVFVIAVLIGLLDVWLRIDSWLFKRRRLHPSYHTNYDIPIKQAQAVYEAKMEDRGAVFHGTCLSCIFRAQNTTHIGLSFCRGCRYFMFERDLPDRSINDYHLVK